MTPAFVPPLMCAGSPGSSAGSASSANNPENKSASTCSSYFPSHRQQPSVSSEEPESDATPRYRRSKLLLTRRVYSLRVPRAPANPKRASSKSQSLIPAAGSQRHPARQAIPAAASSSPASFACDSLDSSSFSPADTPGESPDTSPVPSATPGPFQPETYLDPRPLVPTYFFSHGDIPYPIRRRPGDPPSRYLELRHGLVDPDSPHARNCANPRASNRLRRWYSNAIRWRALHTDFRPIIPLGAERLVSPPIEFPPAAAAAAERRLYAHSQQDRTVQDYEQLQNQQGKKPRHLRQEEQKHKQQLQQFSPSRSTSHELKFLEEPHLHIPPSRQGLRPPPSPASVNSPLPLSPLLVMDGLCTARALARAPRVIVIGDVHGCIEEFQALLRLADFQPGDQVILLGDLVAKGPDSVGVVQMARDIGARTVRGNHDHEVVRWSEASNKGVRHAMISLEHSRIANALSPDERAWLQEAPWFITSPDTQHLFVHAGFIPGVKLTHQNPRLMMNTRVRCIKHLIISTPPVFPHCS
jgi:Calcineurin-like phosphoesterase